MAKAKVLFLNKYSEIGYTIKIEKAQFTFFSFSLKSEVQIKVFFPYLEEPNNIFGKSEQTKMAKVSANNQNKFGQKY